MVEYNDTNAFAIYQAMKAKYQREKVTKNKKNNLEHYSSEIKKSYSCWLRWYLGIQEIFNDITNFRKCH